MTVSKWKTTPEVSRFGTLLAWFEVDPVPLVAVEGSAAAFSNAVLRSIAAAVLWIVGVDHAKDYGACGLGECPPVGEDAFSSFSETRRRKMQSIEV